MTVTSTSYTTGSVKIAISGETVSNNIIAAVNTALTSSALGTWTLHDGIAPAAISTTYSTTGFSPIWTNVYRVLNTDASTYKYFIIRWDTIKNLFYTSTCESWNNSTHVATNECWTGVGVFPQYYDVRDSFIFLSASTKHCVIWPYIRNEPGMWSGVFEFERIASEDLAANSVPCFAWTNSLMLGTPYGRANAVKSNIMFAFPRTADGSTGAAAAQQYAPVTNRGMYPPNYPSATTLTIVEGNMLHLGSYYNLVYGWDATKTVASPIAADVVSKSMPVGRMYNAGITKSIGSFLDTTYLNLDSTGGWPDATGSNTEVILLPLNGGPEGNTASGNTLQYSVAYNSSTPLSKVIAIGGTVWAAANDGVRIWSADSGTGTSPTLVVSNAAVTDILFDGQDYVYAASASHVLKIQASNTAAVNAVAMSNATSNGAAYLGLDNCYLYVTTRTANTQPLCVTIPRNNFLVGNISIFSNSGCNTAVASGFGTPFPDYNGYVYLSTTPGTSASQSVKLATFQANNVTGIANVYHPLRATNAASGGLYSAFWVDPQSSRVFLVSSDATTATTSNGAVYETNTSLNTTIYSNSTFLVTNSTAAQYTSGLAYSTLVAAQAGDFRGDLLLTPIRGLFHVQPKRASGNAAPTWSNRISLNSPAANSAAGVPGIPERIYNPAGAGGTNSIFFDAASSTAGILYHNGPRTYFSDANTTSNNTLGFFKNFYGLTNINGTVTGRIAIKG